MARRLLFTNKASNKGPVGNYIPGAHIGPRSISVRRALQRRASIRYDEKTNTSTYPCRNIFCLSTPVKDGNTNTNTNTDNITDNTPESEPEPESPVANRAEPPVSQPEPEPELELNQNLNQNLNRTRTRTRT